MKKNLLNIPNLITFLRILSVPFLFYFALKGEEERFFHLWIFSVSTDALDGFIARTFHLQTRLGARMDSFADFLIYLVTIWGIYQLKWPEFAGYKTAVFLILFYFVFTDLFSFIKFRKISSLHLYSWKIAGLLQTAFVFWLFYKGFSATLFKGVFIWTSIAFVENMFIQLKANKYLTNQKHFIYFLKNNSLK